MLSATDVMQLLHAANYAKAFVSNYHYYGKEYNFSLQFLRL